MHAAWRLATLWTLLPPPSPPNRRKCRCILARSFSPSCPSTPTVGMTCGWQRGPAHKEQPRFNSATALPAPRWAVGMGGSLCIAQQGRWQAATSARHASLPPPPGAGAGSARSRGAPRRSCAPNKAPGARCTRPCGALRAPGKTGGRVLHAGVACRLDGSVGSGRAATGRHAVDQRAALGGGGGQQ
jgi:hypothetical protein